MFLNRVFRFRASDGKREIEADVRHAHHLVRELGLDGDSKKVATPSVKRSNAEVLEAAKSSPLYERTHVISYRNLTMRLSYLAQGRPDLGFTASAPTESDEIA